jgi:hypothetical protein
MPSFQLTVAVCTRLANNNHYVPHDVFSVLRNTTETLELMLTDRERRDAKDITASSPLGQPLHPRCHRLRSDSMDMRE